MPDTTCCLAHLVRTGRGIMDNGQFLINRAHCSTCRRTWVHICDEAEGCVWRYVPPRRPKGGAS